MKHIKALTLIITCILVTLVCSLLLLVFNIVVRKHIENMAKEAIDYSFQTEVYDYFPEGTYPDYNIPDSSEARAYAQIIALDSEHNTFNSSIFIFYYTYTEKKIANYLKTHSPKKLPFRLSIGNRYYYISQLKGKLVKNDFYYEPAPLNSSLSGTSVIWVSYVEVTPEELILQKVYNAIIFIIIFSILFAGAIGVFIGRLIEYDRKKQKQFFENTSHELKTPLMAIQGYAEGIESGVISDVKKASNIIISESNKMAKLVDEILKLSRLESGFTKINIQKVSLQEIIYDCLYEIEAKTDKKQITLKEEIKEVFINADARQLEIAVRNILSNAVRHADKLIEIKADEEKLTIYNDGDSISKEDLSHIFERFYTGKNGNTGIGMALTKEIIKKHGWDIKAKGLENGTCFIIYFK